MENYIPEVPVNIELNLTNELLDLGVGETVTIEPDTTNDNFGKLIYPNSRFKIYNIPWRVFGKGILLYRSGYYEYRAFDRTCTYKPFEEYCAVENKTDMLVPKCPCCGSKFLLTADGQTTKGSLAIRPLFQYQTTLINNGTRLVISR